MKDSGCEIPEWMLNLKKPSKNKKKDLRTKAVKRDHIRTVSKFDDNKLKRKRDMIRGSISRKKGSASE